MVAGFLDKVGRGMALKEYLQKLIKCKATVSPYALRIGGRTWKLSNGMDRQLVDFLGTWKIPEASARYFRGNPRAILLMVRQFYLESDPSKGPRDGEGPTGVPG